MQNMPNGNASHHVLANGLHTCQQISYLVVEAVSRLLLRQSGKGREEDHFGKQQFCETSQNVCQHKNQVITGAVSWLSSFSSDSSLSRCPGLLSTWVPALPVLPGLILEDRPASGLGFQSLSMIDESCWWLPTHKDHWEDIDIGIPSGQRHMPGQEAQRSHQALRDLVQLSPSSEASDAIRKCCAVRVGKKSGMKRDQLPALHCFLPCFLFCVELMFELLGMTWNEWTCYPLLAAESVFSVDVSSSWVNCSTWTNSHSPKKQAPYKLLAILLISWLKCTATLRTVTWSTQNGENQWNTWNTSNLIIPGPSKGCKMVPKGCQFSIP